MRNIIKLITFTLLSIAQLNGQSTIQIGSGTSTTGYVPIYAYYGYNYSQQIVLASEYSAQNGTAGNITKIRFYLNGNLSNKCDNWTVYLGHTNKTSFSSTSDWVSFTNLTNVFSGTVTGTSGSWMEITLSTPFNYNGTDNIVVAIDENSSGYQSGISWRSYTASNNRAIHYRNDYTNPNPSSPPTASSTTSTLAQIQFEGIVASCTSPTNLNTSNIMATNASLSWTENNSAATWQISYGASGFTVGNGTQSIVNSNPFNLTGLSANTNYQWYVRTICAAGDTSTWAGPFSFTTLCTPYTTPYTEGFESETDGQAISGGGCLSQVSESGSYSWEGNTATSYNRAPRTGSKSARLRYSNTDWIFVPISLTGGTTYRAEVYARQDGSTTSNASLGISYGTSPNVASMTNTIKSSTGLTNGDYQKIFGDFTPASTGIYYVGYKGTINGSPWYITIDDIKIDAAPNCQEPNTLTATNIMATSASLGWTSGGSGESAWNIEYGATGFTKGSGTTIAVNSNPHTLSGLSSNTTYDYYVQANCGGGDTSAWAGPFTFTTPCASFTAPYNQNFDGTSEPNIDDCWNKIEEVTGSYYESVETYDGSYPSAYSAPNSIAMSNNYNTPLATDMLALVSPHFSDFDNTKRIRFYAYDKSGTSDLIIGTMSDPNNSATFTAFQTITAASMPNDAWAEHMVSFATYTGTDKYIVFKHGLGTASDYIYIDNFVYEAIPSCLKPTSPSSANITATSADLSWTENNSASSWQVSYGTSGFTVGNGTQVIANSNPFTLTGLTPNTNYDWYVRSICTAGDTSAWSVVNSFATPCSSYTTTYTQNFDATTAPAIDACWKTLNTTSSSSASIKTVTSSYSFNPHSPSNGISMYNSSGTSGKLLLVSPHFSDFDNTKRIRFYLYDDNHSSDLIIGTMSNPNDATTFTAFKTIAFANMTQDDWEEHTVSFDTYSGTDKYITFAHGLNDSYDYLYLDDFVYEDIPSCLKPNTLVTSSISSSSATLAWTSGGSGETEWEIYATTSSTAPTATTTPTFTATTNPFNMTGLTASSSHKVYVRAVCSASDKSYWSEVSRFNTLCGNINLSVATYCEDFESNSAYITAGGCNATTNIDVCWTGTDVSGGNHWMVSRGNAYYPEEDRFGDEDGQFTHLGTSNASACYGKNSLLTSPIFNNLASITNPAIEFYYFMRNANYTPKQNLKLEITKDGGTTWSILWEKTGPITNDDQWNKATVLIPATYRNATNVQIRFNGTTGRYYGQSIAIDDVCVKGNPCEAINNIIVASSAGLSASNYSCKEGDWRYYEDDANLGKYIFAINWDPNNMGNGHNNSAKDAAVVTIQKDATPKQNSNASEGIFFLGRQWDVNLGSATLDGPVKIKFFYDPAEKAAAEAAATAHANANGIANDGFKWFKQNTAYDFSSYAGTNLNPDVNLSVSTTGTENGKTYIELSGITSFSSGTGAASTGGALLPVEMLYFKANNKNNRTILLKWQTTTEINNDGFAIERSKNGIDFSRIGYIKGNGNSTEINTYEFEDKYIASGTYYYRLKQIDYNGLHKYSNIISASIKNLVQNSVGLVVPNPANDNTKIEINLIKETFVSMSIFDNLGKAVAKDKLYLQPGNQVIPIDLKKHKQGVYIIKIEIDGAFYLRKLVIN